MSDHADLTALVQRAQQLAALSTSQVTRRSSSLLDDEKDASLANYRTIAGWCAEGIQRWRAVDVPPTPEIIALVQVLLQIARLCTNEHDRICQADAARREHSRRRSEVHDEFEAAQREGRPMRSDWSWERHAHWEGPIT